MMQLTSSMVRTLRGAPLAVLVILLLEQNSIGAEYIERHSGYSDKTVMTSLQLLADYGLIMRIDRYHWQIVSQACQLPLMAMAAGQDEAQESLPAEAQAVEEEPKAQPAAGSRRISGWESESFRLPDSSSSSLTTRDSSTEIQPLDSRSAESENLRVDVFAAMDAVGIREPARSRLVGMGHVTPRMIQYHGRVGQSAGLAIYRIEHNFKVPADWVDLEGVVLLPLSAPAEELEPDEDDIPEEIIQKWESALQKLLEISCSWVDSGKAAIADMVLLDYRSGRYTVTVAEHFLVVWLELHNIPQFLGRILCATVMLEVET